MIRQIKNKFKEYYWLTDDGIIYNSKTKKYKRPNPSYCLICENGKQKNITAKQLYQLVYGDNARIDNIEYYADEIAKDIPGTDGEYQITNYGMVISLKGVEAVPLTPQLSKRGYQEVILRIGGKSVKKLVHQLVADAFCEKPDTDEPLVVHHKNYHHGNAADDYAVNLEWLTVPEHIQKHRKKEVK